MIFLLKEGILSLCLFGCGFATVGALSHSKDKYKLAYEYVVNDQRKLGKTIKIADSTVHIDISVFFEELSIEIGQTQKVTLKVLDSLDHLNTRIPTKAVVISSQTKDLINPTEILYFSVLCDNLLVAELLNAGGEANERYERKTIFNEGTRYLFSFDRKSGKIKKIYKKKIQYN